MLRLRQILIGIVMVGLPVLSGLGRTLYVAPGGTNNPPYTNWADAATNIAWAVSVATNGETVWISNGVYILTNAVSVPSGVTLSGLSAIDRPIMDGISSTSRCFVCQKVTLENLFITRGSNYSMGGAVYLGNGPSIIRNCIFSNNVVFGSDSSVSYGGALWVNNGTNLVERCLFIDNKSEQQYGGAVGHNSIDTTMYSNCVFQNNSASKIGGALYGNGKTLIISCEFAGNVAQSGGAVAMYKKMENCLIRNNVASFGGGVEGMGGIISGCTIVSNTAIVSGGGITYWSDLYTNYVENSILYHNIHASIIQVEVITGIALPSSIPIAVLPLL